MTPQDFVLALKNQTADSVRSEVDYYKNPPSKNPPEHLKRFSQWFGQLTRADSEMVTDLIKYSKEGELFTLLTYLDNLASLPIDGGRLELFHIDDDGRRILLNESEGELLTDIFNNLG